VPIHRRLRGATKTALSKLGGRHDRRPKPARRARRLASRDDGPTIDERLAPIAADVLAGNHVECRWELFRLQYFPGWPHERVRAALGLWGLRAGVAVCLERRDVRDSPVIFVCFSA
jgi:hypothetical protein